MGIEGHLHIRLTIGDGVVTSAGIESNRPVHASRVFHGKPVADAGRMLPLLFSICATAQACAGVRACEQALGITASPDVEHLRDRLVQMETVREHLWRILLDWPAFSGGEADRVGMAEAVAIQKEFQQALCPGGDAFRIRGSACKTDAEALTGILERLARLMRRVCFALPPERWLALGDEQALLAWAGRRETPAAVLIDQVVSAGWQDAGACEMRPLPPLDADRLNRSMQNAEYVRAPQWAGTCCETTTLTRTDTPLVRELKRTYGNGLLVRLVARLTELALLAARLASEEGGDRAPAKVVGPVNPGIGQVAAARGQLVHRVGLKGDRVESYQILAPTEWNFHPDGVVNQALSRLKGGPEEIDRQARLLINAIDPCVGYELQVVQVSSAGA